MTPTPEQLAAATSTAPTTIVCAGAGSGKTSTIALRIAHLIRDRGVAPEHIACLVFTRAATAEIRSRVEAELGPCGVMIATLHAFAASRCVGEGQRVATYAEAEAALDSLYAGPMRRPSRGLPGTKQLRAALMRYEAEGATVLDRSEALAVGLVRGRLTHASLIPTWDLVPSALGAAPGEFQHVLVDEYQDTTPNEQWLAIQSGADGAELFAVGDPSQAIMSWRGGRWNPWARAADPATYALTKTWRFGQPIAELANTIAARFGGAPITGAEDVESEVVRCPRELLAEEVAADPKRTLILVRTNHEAKELERELAGLAVHVRRNPRDPLSSEADRFGDVWASGRAILSTIHAAKGREADRVVVMLDVGQVHEEPEENRVVYVAATRARRRLVLVQAENSEEPRRDELPGGVAAYHFGRENPLEGADPTIIRDFIHQQKGGRGGGG